MSTELVTITLSRNQARYVYDVAFEDSMSDEETGVFPIREAQEVLAKVSEARLAAGWIDDPTR